MKKILTVILAVMLMLTMAQAALAESYPEFNFETRTVTLNSGYEMPISLKKKLQPGKPRHGC